MIFFVKRPGQFGFRLRSLAFRIVTLCLLLASASCGGGAEDVELPREQLTGEVLGDAGQVATSSLKLTAAYSGSLDTARAVQRAGLAPMLDMLFMLPSASRQAGVVYAIHPDAEERLIAFVKANSDLLKPGVRALIHDEMYWNPQGSADSVEVLQPQLDALTKAVKLMRLHAPQVLLGITITPYGSIGRPVTLDFIKRAVGQVDWVGTDPYWFGDVKGIADLNEWTRSFPIIAKAANAKVETWLIAQAFKDPAWDVAAFNGLMRTQLSLAQQYDHIIFFGWQFVSELPMSFAGNHFSTETKLIYAPYLKK